MRTASGGGAGVLTTHLSRSYLTLTLVTRGVVIPGLLGWFASLWVQGIAVGVKSSKPRTYPFHEWRASSSGQTPSLSFSLTRLFLLCICGARRRLAAPRVQHGRAADAAVAVARGAAEQPGLPPGVESDGGAALGQPRVPCRCALGDRHVVRGTNNWKKSPGWGLESPHIESRTSDWFLKYLLGGRAHALAVCLCGGDNALPLHRRCLKPKPVSPFRAQALLLAD